MQRNENSGNWYRHLDIYTTSGYTLGKIGWIPCSGQGLALPLHAMGRRLVGATLAVAHQMQGRERGIAVGVEKMGACLLELASGR